MQKERKSFFSQIIDLFFEPANQPVGLTQLARQPIQAKQDAGIFSQNQRTIADYRYEKIINPDLSRAPIKR